MKDQQARKAARAYEKPRLRIIELVAEEVLAVGCKTFSPIAMNVGNPSCGIPNGCVTQGS